MFPGVRMEGWRRWFAHPLGGGVAGGMLNTLVFSQVPLFAPGSSQVAVGMFVVVVVAVLFVSLSGIGPNCTCTKLFLGPMQFVCILLLEEICVHVQALQQRVSDPRLFHNQEGCDQ